MIVLDAIAAYIGIGLFGACVVFVRNATLPDERKAGELVVILLCAASVFVWPLLLVLLLGQWIEEYRNGPFEP